MKFGKKNMETNKDNKEEEIKRKLLQMKNVVKAFCTKEALQRLNFVEVAHPMKALKAYIYLYQLLSAGRITKVDERIVKEVLSTISKKEDKGFRFLGFRR